MVDHVELLAHYSISNTLKRDHALANGTKDIRAWRMWSTGEIVPLAVKVTFMVSIIDL